VGTIELVALWAIAAILVGVVTYGAWIVWRAHRLTAAAASELERDGWLAIGGDRLELRDTGFCIELVRRDGQYPYWLFTPEGHRVGGTPDLEALKRHGERMAADRALFTAGLADLHRHNAQLIERIARKQS